MASGLYPNEVKETDFDQEKLDLLDNYTFGQPAFSSQSEHVFKRGTIRKVAARRTWTEKTGYNFEEVYEGPHEDINYAFDDSRYVCGASQVIAQRDYASEKASMTISFAHRTKEEALANLAQPEEFKSVWTWEPQIETLPIWRHPVYAVLDEKPYVSGTNYPLARQIWMATTQYLAAWENRYSIEITEAIRNIPIDQPEDIVFLQLGREFDIWKFVEPPSEEAYPDPDEREALMNLGRSMAHNLLYGRTTYVVYRHTLKHTAVVASNAGLSAANIRSNRLYRVHDMVQEINQNVFGLDALRSTTPAGCRPVNVPKKYLIRDLESGRFKDTKWLAYPGMTNELTNGSIEVVRMWVERFDFEIDENLTPYLSPEQ